MMTKRIAQIIFILYVGTLLQAFVACNCTCHDKYIGKVVDIINPGRTKSIVNGRKNTIDITILNLNNHLDHITIVSDSIGDVTLDKCFLVKKNNKQCAEIGGNFFLLNDTLNNNNIF